MTADGHENLVPVDLQVCSQPQPAVRPGELAGHVQQHHTRQPRREARVGDLLPLAVLAPAFELRRQHGDAGLLRRVDRLRVGIIRPAGQAKEGALVGLDVL